MPHDQRYGRGAHIGPLVKDSVVDDAIADESDNEPIEDLLPQTISGLASRLLVTTTFADRVYRESEMDALWTMADMAVAEMEEAERHGAKIMPRPELPNASQANLVTLSDLIFRAHDLNADGESVKAAELLFEAARLCASWS